MSEAFSQQYFVALNSHQLVKHFGSLTAASIFSRAEYWFSRKVDQFYKFIEPCAHPCYRQGDSWCEELGISRKAFWKAFELIGVRYTSKTQFDQEDDPFKGKFFAYYFDRKANKTVFVRNHKVVEAFIKSLREALTLPKREALLSSTIEKGGMKQAGEGDSPEQVASFQGQSRIVPEGQSYAHAYKENKNKTSFSQKNAKNDLMKEGEMSQVASQMREIWIDEIGEKDMPQTSNSLMKRLYQAFVKFFQNSLERWRAYCRKIASSKFLMGEGRHPGFRAWIHWAITKDAMERIEGGEFKFDRTPPKVLKKSAELWRIRYERDQAIRNLEELKAEFERKLAKEARQKIEEASEDQKEVWEQSFLKDLEETNPAYATDFKAQRWETPFADISFGYHVSNLLFGDVENNDEYKRIKKILEERIASAEERLKDVNIIA